MCGPVHRQTTRAGMTHVWGRTAGAGNCGGERLGSTEAGSFGLDHIPDSAPGRDKWTLGSDTGWYGAKQADQNDLQGL